MRFPHAVIFDMDGLMLDTEKLSIKAMRQAAKKLKLEFDDQWLFDIIGMNGKGAYQYLEEKSGAPLPKELDELYIKLYAEQVSFGIGLKAGLIELFKFLQTHGVRRAVATSTRTEMARKKLAATGIDHWLEQIVCGDQVENGKPAPDIYLKAAAMIGLDPGDCLALEDSDNGAMAAHAAGLQLIVVPDLKEPSTLTKKIADFVMDDLVMVKNYLERQTNRLDETV